MSSSSTVSVNELRANLPLMLTTSGQEKANFHFGVSVTMIVMYHPLRFVMLVVLF